MDREGVSDTDEVEDVDGAADKLRDTVTLAVTVVVTDGD